MNSSTTTPEIRPFRVEIPQADLDDLHQRLERTRYAPAAPGDSWDYGTPVSYLGDMVERWKAFDWRAVEASANAHPNFLTEVDGQTIHFIHVRSEVPGARPLLLAHTYPGSFLEFLDMIEPLTDPVAHGGRPEDAFHVVVPSMPGFGFSTPAGGRRLDDGPGGPRVRLADAPARLRLLRHPRQRRRRHGVPRARHPRPRGLPRSARAAAVLVPEWRARRDGRLRGEGVRRARTPAVVPERRRATTR